MVKESTYNAGDVGSIPGSGIPWRRAWQPTPVFSPGESHGLRSLEGCSPWGHKGSDATEGTEHMCLLTLGTKVGLALSNVIGT